MLRVTIAKPPTEAKSKLGKPYRYQVALVYFHDRDGNAEEFPRPVRTFVQDGEPGYPTGEYHIDADKSFRPAQGDNIEVRLALVTANGSAVGGRARAA